MWSPSMFILQKRAARTFFKITHFVFLITKYVMQVRNNMRVKDDKIFIYWVQLSFKYNFLYLYLDIKRYTEILSPVWMHDKKKTLRRTVNRKRCGAQRMISAGLSFSPGCQSQLDECPWDVASYFPSCLAVIHMSGQLITEWSREWRCRCLFWSLPKFLF